MIISRDAAGITMEVEKEEEEETMERVEDDQANSKIVELGGRGGSGEKCV